MISKGEPRTALYRFYGTDETLLYVGITDDPWRRWREHVQTQPWYPLVKHQAITWYEDRLAAEIAERVAIRRERPRFNIAGAVRPVAVELPAELVLHPPAVLEVPAKPASWSQPESRPDPPPEVRPRLRPEPAPEPEPEGEPTALPEPKVAPAPLMIPGTAPAGWQADPLLNTRRGRRILMTVMVCVVWAFLPSFPGMPFSWRSPWMEGLVISTIIPVLVILVIAFAPKLHRLGRWLDASFGPPREFCE
jgi:hypothetical protein